MSDIYGIGYGSSHNWMRGHTNQADRGEVFDCSDKATQYECKDCGARFAHHYDVISNIFEAIKQSGVVDECPHKEDSHVK